MTSRDQTLALVLFGAVVLTVGGVGGYLFIWQPIQKQRATEATLEKEIEDLKTQENAQADVAKRLAVARLRSLPADEAMARREYTVALERLLESAGVPKGYTISPKGMDNSARNVPEISKGKPVYNRVAYEVVFKKADMWAVKEFLEGYYKLGLLHQITAISIKKDDDPGAKNAGRRNDLTVTLTTEAILVDGAENRRTLLPVPTAYAAIGGAALHRGLSASPEAARAVPPQALVPVLATNHRDYTLMVQKDPFNGPLPPPPPFKMDKLASEVKIKTDERPSPVKVPLSGDGSVGAHVVAIASGSLFAPGELKVDPKTHAIELPKTAATEGTATVSVVATSADGKVTHKGSFKVSLAESSEKTTTPPPKEDLSAFIVLIGVSPRDDGTTWARIVDNANRARYQIDAGPKGVTVVKEELLIPRRGWQVDSDHKHPVGVMHISDDKSGTNRLLKIVEVDYDGLVVADLKPNGSAPAPAKPMGGGMGPPVKAPPRQGPGNPLAAVAGNVALANPQPKIYRWQVGQPLSGLKALPEDEAKKYQKLVAEAGGGLDVAGGP